MSASNPPETSSTLRLHDGRALGYAEVGKNDGFPLFYFHGHHSSRLEVLLWTEMAITLGVRMIALDRPVYWLLGTSVRKIATFAFSSY